jgi:flagellar basal-body rod modification protein FlgD
MDISAVNSSSTSSTAFSQLTRNIDSFLTLLTAQLRNQDPLDPLDTEKFTSQLVEFASVEQSIATNRNLESLISLQSLVGRQSALDFVGRTVEIASDKALKTDAGATWTYETPAGAAAVRLSVLDASGRVVGSAIGDIRPGAHAFVWDGRDNADADAPDGVYTLRAEAADVTGGARAVAIRSATRVDSASFIGGDPSLETPIGAIGLASVLRVTADRE